MASPTPTSAMKKLKEPLGLFCGYTKRDGTVCKGKRIVGERHCRHHNNLGGRPAKAGLYHHLVDSSLQTIYAEVEAQGKTLELSRPDLEEELIIGRVQLIALLKNPQASAGIRLKAIETVSRIVKTAKIIKEIDASALRQEFLDSILNAITFAWTRANSMQDPSQRTKTFVSELAMWFPALTGETGDDIITGQVVSGNEEEDPAG